MSKQLANLSIRRMEPNISWNRNLYHRWTQIIQTRTCVNTGHEFGSQTIQDGGRKGSLQNKEKQDERNHFLFKY